MVKNDNKSSIKSSKKTKQSKLKKAIKELKIFEKNLKAKEKEIDKKLKKLKTKKFKVKKKESLINSSNKKVELKKKKRKQKKQKAKTISASLDKKVLLQKEPLVDKIKDINKKTSSIELTARETIAGFRDFTEINEIDSFIRNETRVSILRAASSRKNAIQKNLDKSQTS